MLAAVALAALAAACSGGDGGRDDTEPEATVTTDATPVHAERTDPLPIVIPTPRELRWLGPDLEVPRSVTLAAAPGADEAALAAATDALEAAGAEEVVAAAPEREGDVGDALAASEAGAPGLTVVVGATTDPPVAAALEAAGVDVPGDLPAEGYALAAFGRRDGSATVVVGGADPAGTFYGAQTLRQLARDGAIAGVAVVDHPAMRHRGSIEGFY
ncbi:MAG TPA: glycoside hydrolase family 20 zincin-like fold domain-containing protein, partial [Acidimicrobiales bacterium]